ncbi:MAG: Hsp70 family protein, partial [Aggregatilineales bacterium]
MPDQQPAAIFGIDLGTTYSVIAYIDQYNRPTVIPNAAGDRTTPSVVQFAGAERIVGKEAKNNVALYPDSTVQMIKRYMGSSSYTFIYEGVTYTPEEISSYILRKLVQDAEQYTGLTISDVVITCPAYFGIPEREATARAGAIAGLNVRSIINEPTAAAIAYGVNEQGDQVVLVYDLGGGTFDVTLIEIKDGNITVVATDGDHFLGGRNWDEAIVTYLASEWQRETGSPDDPTDSLETLEDLLLKAEVAKQTLTTRAQTDVRVVHNGLTARVTLTRDKFDELTQHLLDRTIELTRQALAEAAKRGYTRFDQLLLVGGATRMPQVAARLLREFNVEPRIYEPDEAVAKGAAIYGQKLGLDEEIKI